MCKLNNNNVAIAPGPPAYKLEPQKLYPMKFPTFFFSFDKHLQHEVYTYIQDERQYSSSKCPFGPTVLIPVMTSLTFPAKSLLLLGESEISNATYYTSRLINYVRRVKTVRESATALWNT